MTIPQKEIQPRILWGKVITYLRENKNIAIQMACGDITKVVMHDGKFVAHTTEEYNFNLLSQDFARREVEKAFRWFGQNLNFEVVLDERQVDKQNIDIEKLKAMFGEIKIID